MESHRQGYPVNERVARHRQGYPVNGRVPRHPQAGITVIGFLILAAIFGFIGLAVLKIFPLYLEKMRINRVLEDVQSELSASGSSIQNIRLLLEQRFYVENLSIPREEIEIARAGEGFTVRVVRDARASFVADLSFIVSIDQQVEIGR